MAKKYMNEENKYMLGELKNVILLILTVIDLIFIFLSIAYSFDFRIDNLFADYDFMVCVLLFIDLAYEFYTSDRTIKQFLFDDRNILSLISIIPFDIIFRYFAIFRLFRFMKIFKVIRVYNVIRDVDSVIYFIQNHLFKLLFIVLMIYMAVSTVLLYILDNSFNTLGDALWFIIVTTTTVGYGDVTPASIAGKYLTVLTMVIGILFVAIFTAYLSAIYNEKTEEETRKTVLENAILIEENNQILREQLYLINDRITALEEENQELKELLREEYINERE
ncbi:MAG: potassium channel family protein [Methanosphaera sp.]|nr:potassium channel family protein [Methanosphaera sp.]